MGNAIFDDRSGEAHGIIEHGLITRLLRKNFKR